MKLNPILINLASRRFIGFLVAVITVYLKPEIQNTLVLLYGALVAHSVANDYIQNKNGNKKEEKIE